MNVNQIFKILLSPHVSEKAANAADAANAYVFRVANDASKPEIKEAVQKLFQVEVESVRVVNLKGKTKRFGARLGRRSDTRKAYVKVKAGQQIDFMSAEKS
ncbi:MAG: 50S ribosomal protein L23 [Thiotrichales bacterium]